MGGADWPRPLWRLPKPKSPAQHLKERRRASRVWSLVGEPRGYRAAGDRRRRVASPQAPDPENDGAGEAETCAIGKASEEVPYGGEALQPDVLAQGAVA